MQIECIIELNKITWVEKRQKFIKNDPGKEMATFEK